MYKESCLKKFHIHFWFVILFWITNQNLFVQTNGLNDSVFIYETEHFQKTIVKPNKASFFFDFTQISLDILNYKDLKKSNFYQEHNVLIILGLLFLIFVIIYKCYSSKNEINKDLALKQEKINDQSISLKKLLLDKEWLLKELHHRVKNNLQVVISLLNTQSAYLENKDALLAIQDSQNRMFAMSLIHQKLYQNDNLSTIDMHWYIPELVSYLKSVFDADHKIAFLLDIDHVDLDVAQAMPLGLILNEAIINALKYAYPETHKGEVKIFLKEKQDNLYQLIISDNGVGVPDFELKNRNSLGMNLMYGLSNQIEGSFEVESKNGLSITLNFKKNGIKS
jgi:two-component sensor histidine kinase